MNIDNMATRIFKDCEIMAADDVDLNDSRRFVKLDLTQGQQMHMSNLLDQLPKLVGSDNAPKVVSLKFSEGIQDALAQLKNEGLAATLKNLDIEKLLGPAGSENSVHKMVSLGAATVLFAAAGPLFVASGQYFLMQITSRLDQISLGLDKILAFLYGDKRAELLSEVSFIKFAYKNYLSIMDHSEQRIATLIGLQDAKKVAVKDIEFYLSDLAATISDKKSGDITSTVPKMVRTKECLDLSLQLYTMSSLLEVYYSENYDSKYISFVQSETTDYIGKCERKELNCFGQLQHLLAAAKDGLFIKVNKNEYIQQIDAIVAALETTTPSQLQTDLYAALSEINEKKQYYINQGGEVYLMIS